MIRINLMPLEERGQKARKVKKQRSGGSKTGLTGLLFPLAIVAGVLVAIVGTVVHQQAQIHMLAGEVARVEEESRALAPQIAQHAPFALALGALYGLLSGAFLGRALRLWRLARGPAGAMVGLRAAGRA